MRHLVDTTYNSIFGVVASFFDIKEKSFLFYQAGYEKVCLLKVEDNGELVTIVPYKSGLFREDLVLTDHFEKLVRDKLASRKEISTEKSKLFLIDIETGTIIFDFTEKKEYCWLSWGVQKDTSIPLGFCKEEGKFYRFVDNVGLCDVAYAKNVSRAKAMLPKGKKDCTDFGLRFLFHLILSDASKPLPKLVTVPEPKHLVSPGVSSDLYTPFNVTRLLSTIGEK